MAVLESPQTTKATPASVNEEGKIERLFWKRAVPGGGKWQEETPVRAIRRTATRVRIIFLEPVFGAKDLSRPESWEAVETWAKATNLTPRAPGAKHDAATAHPDF